MRNAKLVRKEMIMGLLIWLAAVGIVLAVIATNKLAALAGLVFGTLAAAGLIFHMYHHLDIALDMDAKHAQSHTQVAAFQRMFIMGAVVVVSMFLSEYMHPVGAVLGLFGVKVSALMNPVIHKKLHGGERKA